MAFASMGNTCAVYKPNQKLIGLDLFVCVVALKLL